MIITIKSIAINSPVEKAANKFSGTIQSNICDTVGISGLSKEVFGKVKFIPGVKNNGSDTPIKTARAVVIGVSLALFFTPGKNLTLPNTSVDKPEIPHV